MNVQRLAPSMTCLGNIEAQRQLRDGLVFPAKSN